MQEETPIGREKDELKWKQTLTFNALYWLEREGGREEGRGSCRQGGMSDEGGK